MKTPLRILREWLFVGADGRPYCLMRRLVEKKPFDYDWVSFISGGGHLNMNLFKKNVFQNN